VVAPDSFKGSLSAVDVAECIADGWRSVRPGDYLELIPQADGGEGTVDAVSGRHPDAIRHYVPDVTGPDGRIVVGEWLLLPDGTAVIELAQMSGLPLMRELDPGRATTYGLGQVIAAALDAGVRRIVIGLGGSASTDGGAGMLEALGAVITDESGLLVQPGGLGLSMLDNLDLSGLRELPAEGVEVLTDTTAPLLGPNGAAAVFGAQKGASAAMIVDLADALTRYADRLKHIDPTVPGAGAAGGTGFGLLAWGASLVSGAESIADLTGLSEVIAHADVVVTGEGRYDVTSGTGKLVGALLERCGRNGVRSVVIAGQLAATPPDIAVSLTETAGSVEEAMLNPRRWLVEAGMSCAARFSS